MVEEEIGMDQVACSGEHRSDHEQGIAITTEYVSNPVMFAVLVTGFEDQIFANVTYNSKRTFNMLGESGRYANVLLKKNLCTVPRGGSLLHGVTTSQF